MKNPSIIVVSLFIFIFLSLMGLLAFVLNLADETSRQPEFLQRVAENIINIIEIFAGAVVGALSAAFAQSSFAKPKTYKGKIQDE